MVVSLSSGAIHDRLALELLVLLVGNHLGLEGIMEVQIAFHRSIVTLIFIPSVVLYAKCHLPGSAWVPDRLS